MRINKNDTFAENDTTSRISLKELNYEEARIYYGNLTLLSMLMVVGIIGNLHILHIYKYKKPKSTTRIYVIFLAIIDLLACGVVIPFNLATCLLPFMYYDTVSCKIFTFLKGLNSFGSACALLVIAIQRYRKICKPFKRQMTLRHAKLSCCLVVLFASISSIPIFVLVGSTRMPTKQPGTYGFHCGTLTEMKDTYFYIIFMGYTVLFSSTACIIMMVLYSFIGLKLLKQPKKVQRNQTIYLGKVRNSDMSRTDGTLRITIPDEERTESMTNESAIDDSNNDVQTSVDRQTDECVSSEIHVTGKTAAEKTLETRELSNKSILQKAKSRRKTIEDTIKTTMIQKTNVIFFLITLCYVISYIPYPVLRICQALSSEWYDGLDHVSLIVFYTFIGTLYINNVANSFIYTLCDRHYRLEMQTFYAELFRKCCRSNQKPGF